jgi:O-antigen ligase
MYWGYELTSKNLFHALVGIGFGTPIFNIYNPLNHFLFEGPPSVVYPYALGAHNFLIFTFTRLGLTGLIPVIAIYLCFFNQVRHKRLDSKTNALFLAFILMTVGALCNVVFATPVYSGTYWVLAGMLFQSLTKIPYNSQ